MPVYKDILGFDVSVCDREHWQVIQGSEDLVRVYFDEMRVYVFLFDELVKIVGVIVHNDVEVLAIAFLREETIFHDQIVGVFQHR